MMLVALWLVATDLAGAYLMTFEFPFAFGTVVKAMVPDYFLPHVFLFSTGLAIRITAAFKLKVPVPFALAGLAAALAEMMVTGDFGHELSHAIVGQCSGYGGHILWPSLAGVVASVVIVLSALANFPTQAAPDLLAVGTP